MMAQVTFNIPVAVRKDTTEALFMAIAGSLVMRWDIADCHLVSRGLRTQKFLIVALAYLSRTRYIFLYLLYGLSCLCA